MSEQNIEDEIDSLETSAQSENPTKASNNQVPDDSTENTISEEPKEEPKVEQNDLPANSEDEKSKDGFGKEGHTPKGVQQRFSEFSRKLRMEREENARLKQRLEAIEKSLPKPKEKTREDFANDEEWINHLATARAEEIISKRMAEYAEAQEQAPLEQAYAKAEDEARSRMPDYDDVMSEQVNLPANKETYLHIKSSQYGPMIVYTLKKIEAVRNQYLATPETGRLAFVKSVENRLKEIQTKASSQTQQAKPQIRQPMVAQRTVPRRLDPSTCSMEDWMNNGD